MSSDYFRQLGARVERAWLDAGRDEESFPDVAERVLAELHPRDHFDREAFLDAELDPFAPARRERAPLGAFGQPAATVYFGRDFVIEVYFWVDSIAGIHDHPFRGLFVILEGESVHARYTFEERERIGARMRLGELRVEELELLATGEHRLFSDARHALIHTLVHVPSPALSMVIRTVHAKEYWRFLPPGVAVLYDEPDAVVARQLMLLEGLRRTNDPRYAARLVTYLRSSDLFTSLHALSPSWGGLDDASRSAVLEVMRERHGSGADAVARALSRAWRVEQANTLRSSLRDPDDRLVATLLVCAERRAQIVELLGRRHPDPIARLHRFIDELGAFATGDELSNEAAHLLIDGGGLAALERHIESRFGADTLAAQRSQIARFATESLFAALTEP